jgi:hypothetical protein
MSTTVTLSTSYGPLDIRCRPTGDGITVMVQTGDWRESVTFTGTRAELLTLSAEIEAALIHHPPVPSDPDYQPEEPRFEYADIPTHDGLDDDEPVLYVNWGRTRVHRWSSCAGGNPERISAAEAAAAQIPPCWQCHPSPLSPSQPFATEAEQDEAAGMHQHHDVEGEGR